MKIAIFHHLPTGGAKRALYEYVKNSQALQEADLYGINLDEHEKFLDMRMLVGNVYNYTFAEKALPRFLKGFRLFMPYINIKLLDKLQKKVAEDIEKGGYDLVFVHHCYVIQSPPLLRYLKTPSVYYMQEPRRTQYEKASRPVYPKITGPLSLLRILFQGWNDRIKARLDEESVMHATKVICNSYYSAESIYRAYAIVAEVSYLGVDQEVFPTRKAPPKNTYLLAVGALHPAKGYDLAINAISYIDNKIRPKLIIAYDRSYPGYSDFLQSLAASKGVALELKEKISDEELVTLYQGAMFTLCVAHLEPFGFTPLESMSCGTPVIAIKEAGYRETVVDGVNGYLSDRDEEALSQAILKGIKSHTSFSPEELSKYVAENWSWNRSVEKLHSIFEKTLKKHSKK